MFERTNEEFKRANKKSWSRKKSDRRGALQEKRQSGPIRT